MKAHILQPLTLPRLMMVIMIERQLKRKKRRISKKRIERVE